MIYIFKMVNRKTLSDNKYIIHHLYMIWILKILYVKILVSLYPNFFPQVQFSSYLQWGNTWYAKISKKFNLAYFVCNHPKSSIFMIFDIQKNKTLPIAYLKQAHGPTSLTWVTLAHMKIFFLLNIKCAFHFLLPHLTLGGHDFNKLGSVLCQKAFM
jgi:hypothetical protein